MSFDANLLPGAQGEKRKSADGFLSGASFVLDHETTCFIRLCFCQCSSQTADGATDFAVLVQDGISTINAGRYGWIVIRNLPEDTTIRGTLNIFLRESRNFFIAIQHHANLLATAGFIKPREKATGTPESNYIGLSNQHHLVREITEHSAQIITATGTIDNYVAVMRYQQVKQSGQFSGRRAQGSNLTNSGQQVKIALTGGHETLQQRLIHAVQVLQGVRQSERWPRIKVKRCMPESGKVD